MKKSNLNEFIYTKLPFILILCWSVLSFISAFILPYSKLVNPFVIFSILVKLLVSGIAGYLFYQFYIKQYKDINFYNKAKSFIGYGIVITYVFYAFPRIAYGFYNAEASQAYIMFDFVFITFITAFPAAAYLFLRSHEVKLATKVFKQSDIDVEIKIKKDKQFRKEHHKKLRAERNFLQNLWYEWIDIIIQAILIVMLINQFLFQMYAIPSESMVPTFLKGDMVIVNKLIYGPQIPLLDKRLYSPVKPKVGDIVVFLNPETDDPDSEERYENLFARIFQPFLYRLTFTKLDIDKGENGKPKIRFVVKRLIAKKNEKVCMVNNKVYKKTPDSDWKLMKKEYGQVDLHYSEHPGMEEQMMTPVIRDILNKTVDFVDTSDITNENSLSELKQELIQKLKKTNYRLLRSDIKQYVIATENIVNAAVANNRFVLQGMLFPYMFMKQEFNTIDERAYNNYLSEALLEYQSFPLYKILNEFTSYLDAFEKDSNFFEQEIVSTYNEVGSNPYDKFMNKLNYLYKIEKVKFYLSLIDNKSNIVTYLSNISVVSAQAFANLYNFDIYLDGLRVPDGLMAPGMKYYSFFDTSQFPEYPQGENNYLTSRDYFMMGDNRYNSLDSRFGDEMYTVYLDQNDRTSFGASTEVKWGPHSIDTKYILGKAMLIYYPFDRFGFLK